jgi:hypothetical protein
MNCRARIPELPAKHRFSGVPEKISCSSVRCVARLPARGSGRWPAHHSGDLVVQIEKSIFTRMLDGAMSCDRTRAAGEGCEKVRALARPSFACRGWTIAQAHAIAADGRHQLLQEIAQIVRYFFWQDFMHMSYSVLHVFPA